MYSIVILGGAMSYCKTLFSSILIFAFASGFAEDSSNSRHRRMLSFDTALRHLNGALFDNEASDLPGETRIAILFVDSNSSEEGDGSLTNPYNNISLAQEHSKEGDVIYVFPNSSPNGMDKGFVLKDRQCLIGLDTLSEAPTLTNLEGNVIQLANDNTILGFKIIAHEGWAIYGENIHNVELYGNEIILEGDALLKGGIYLSNISGIANIEGNFIKSTESNGQHGIMIQNNGTLTAHLNLYGNGIENFETGIAILGLDNSTTYSRMAHNIAQDCKTACIDAESCDSAFHSTHIFDNKLTLSDGHGLLVTSSSIQPMQAKVNENQMYRCGIGASLSTGKGGQLVGDVKHNIILQSKDIGFIAQTSPTGFDTFNLNLNENASTNGFLLVNGNPGAIFNVESSAGNIGEITDFTSSFAEPMPESFPLPLPLPVPESSIVNEPEPESVPESESSIVTVPEES